MIPPLIQLLANVPPAASDSVSGNVLVAIIGAIFSGFALLYGKRQGIKEATNNITLQSPVPEVPTRKVPGAVTWDHLQPLIQRIDRMERHLDEVRKEQSDQYRETLEAGGAREHRIITHLDDVARAIHARIDTIMKLPRTR